MARWLTHAATDGPYYESIGPWLNIRATWLNEFGGLPVLLLRRSLYIFFNLHQISPTGQLLTQTIYRSTGGSSLEIWLRHLGEGISFQKTYQASNGCKKSNWTGSAFFIGGGYVWNDVYTIAAANNVVVVGGGDPVCLSMLESFAFVKSHC